MNRRETFRLIPLTVLSMRNFIKDATAQENNLPFNSKDKNLPLAVQYPKKVKEMLTRVRMNQSEKILESAYAIARTVLKGNTCWGYWDLGHTHTADLFPGRNGEPKIVTPGYDSKKAKKGDLVLVSYSIGQEMLDDFEKKGIFVIGAASPVNGDCENPELLAEDLQKIRVRSYADIWIETNITSHGALVYIPGMPSPLGPVSGPLYMTLFWMMMADACRILALENKPVPVKGDEPKLSADTKRVKLADPLLDDFFDEIMLELDLIGAELGNLRKIASMVVDTLLEGGKTYFYSRYGESLAAESHWRRGGFSFALGISDNNIAGSDKDCVVMGIYEPDDEADLRNLDEFKKRGMRVASLGPISRDFTIPEGRTVHKETEAHIGRMTDTYGMFALPGFDRKVCPTSGILNTTMLWSLCMEITEQLINRTGGDVPAVYFNGGLKTSSDYGYNSRMRVFMLDRGY